MSRLDSMYVDSLQVGLLVLKQAVESGSREWVEAEIELLHNMPSLIGENNKARHRYFWLQERRHYLDWVSSPGREEAKSRMLTFYEPIWREMEPVVREYLDLKQTEE
ncbi:MAG TPA: hypothetical protein VFT74_03750, partial [Isosphaeraceae bacterium]|nr:hypothetical protein [Isosphaeraceae bacterium]